MVTIFGMPADGVVLFGTCIVLLVMGFIASECLASIKTERVSKGKVQAYKRSHK